MSRLHVYNATSSSHANQVVLHHFIIYYQSFLLFYHLSLQPGEPILCARPRDRPGECGTIASGAVARGGRRHDAAEAGAPVRYGRVVIGSASTDTCDCVHESASAYYAVGTRQRRYSRAKRRYSRPSTSSSSYART